MSNYAIIHVVGEYWCKSYFINDFLKKLRNCVERHNFIYLAEVNGGKVEIEVVDKSSDYLAISRKYNQIVDTVKNPVVYDGSVIDNFGCGKLRVDIYGFEDVLGWCSHHAVRDADELEINGIVYSCGEDFSWERPKEEQQAEIEAARRQCDNK